MIKKITCIFIAIFITISYQVNAENKCKDTSIKSAYVMPTKEETSQALLLYEKSKKLLITGKKAQNKSTQQCLKIIIPLLSERKAILKQISTMHKDFIDISAGASAVSICNAGCSLSNIENCNQGLSDLEEGKQYLNCINDTYYHLAQ